MHQRSSNLSRLAAVVAVMALLSVAGAWGQATGYQLLTQDEVRNASHHTANLQSAEPWSEGGVLVWGDVRTWKFDNWTFAAGARMGVGEEMDAELTLFHMDITGDDPIAGVVRESEMTLLGLNFKWVAHRGERLTVSVIPGAEFPLGSIKGTNPAVPATAATDDIIPVIAVPLEFSTDPGTIFRLVPRFVGFDEAPDVRDGTSAARTRPAPGPSIDGFGSVFAIGAGVLHDFGEYSITADGTFLVEGYNSVRKDTNTLTDEFVWSVGGAWHPEGNETRVDLFVTNAAGPTSASSVIAAPDSSTAFGVRVSGEF